MRRLVFALLVFSLVMGGALWGGYWYLTRVLRERIEAGFGLGSRVGEVHAGWHSLTLKDLRLQGRAGQEDLSISEVLITPDLQSFLTGSLRLRSVDVRRPLITFRRAPEGHLIFVPLAQEREHRGEEGRPLRIGTVRVADGRITVLDRPATPPLHIEGVQVVLTSLSFPVAHERTQFRAEGRVGGGTLSAGGWIDLSRGDGAFGLHLASVGLAPLQPYFRRRTDIEIQRGFLDLKADVTLEEDRIRAPATVGLSDLTFTPSRGRRETFLGVPAVLLGRLFQDTERRVALHFTVEGDLRDPAFNLREAVITNLMVALAEKMGVTIVNGDLGFKGRRK